MSWLPLRHLLRLPVDTSVHRVRRFANAVEAANIDETHVRSLFEAADKNGDGVLDIDEFVDIVSTSACLSSSFGAILGAAREKREREEIERLSVIFRSPTKLSSPNGSRRLRPSLSHLRSAQEVAGAMPWDDRMPVTGGVPYSPHKSQMIRPTQDE